ncbi:MULTISPECIES: DUF4142 domain-containing protein [unclassified Actinoplanes]|uniref:DUF4142 domain-containing protein n=1 Tax=unclassified Actinoplanes TaxID=2626549 RepID=UPI0002E852F7|nr:MULTISPECIES: DUF4142 domain-containing protein [unclassified Actinoplanes]
MATLLGMLVLPAAPARAVTTPATATDRDFVRRVHLTATAVGAASALARGMSGNTSVKRLTAQVTPQCEQLDGLSRSVAGTLRVALTDPLAAEQQSALATLQQSGGEAFDAGYVDYLWRADSALLPIATTVKGTTRNAVVRRLAERAEAVTAEQLPMLQDSGLLRMTVLPTPATPATPATAASASAVGRLPGGVPMDRRLMAETRSGTGYLAPPIWLRLAVLIIATAVAGVLSRRLLTRRRTGRPRRRWAARRSRGTGRGSPGRHSRVRRPQEPAAPGAMVRWAGGAGHGRRPAR